MVTSSSASATWTVIKGRMPVVAVADAGVRVVSASATRRVTVHAGAMPNRTTESNATSSAKPSTRRSSEKTVGWVIERLYELWGVTFPWTRDKNPGPPECTFLKLDASKAHAHLGWRPKLDLPTTLDWIVKWTRRYQAGDDMRKVSLEDIERFMKIVPVV